MVLAELRARRLLYRHLPSWKDRVMYQLFRQVWIQTEVADFSIFGRAKSSCSPALYVYPHDSAERYYGCVLYGGSTFGQPLPYSDKVLTLLVHIKADPLEFMRSVNWERSDELDRIVHFRAWRVN